MIVKGELDLLSFKPSSSSKESILDAYRKYVLNDGGKALLDVLKKDKNLKGKGFKVSISKGRRVIEFTNTREIADIKFAKLTSYKTPGNFEGKIYNFILNKEALDIEDLSSQKIKESIKEITGSVSAYRDGFQIGSGKSDWLGLANEMTSGSGGYSLRPVNVTGYINLTWKNNRNLMEKSDRESFVDNQEYRSFYNVCQYVIETINSFLNRSRRESLEWLKELVYEEADKPRGYSAKHAIQELEQVINLGTESKPKVEKLIQKSKVSFEENRESIKREVEKNKLDMSEDPRVDSALSKLQNLIENLESQTHQQLNEYLGFTKQLTTYTLAAERVLAEIEGYESQIKNFYDHVAVGLTAQELAHEANSQINNIQLHALSAEKIVKELKIRDSRLSKELIGIKADARVLSKVTASLNPLVRAQRQTKEVINVSEFLADYKNLRIGYFEGKGIELVINESNGNAKPIYFNRGKLFQIVDNIVRNSEHWLTNLKVHEYAQDLSIKITVDKNIVTIWDSGRGVRPELNDVLFDMFSSDKEEGQGLGLYIAKTLMEEHGCSISLLSKENEHGRRFKFQLDLTEATK